MELLQGALDHLAAIVDPVEVCAVKLLRDLKCGVSVTASDVKNTGFFGQSHINDFLNKSIYLQFP